MTKFFKKFPVINYNGTPAVNLMTRVNMSKLSLKNSQAYYTYVMPEGERADNLSYDYYKDSDFMWLLAISNQVVDPYYDFPISGDDLNKLIAKKYGSFDKAVDKIVFFRNNWISDDSFLSLSAYNALGVGQKKYWDPEVTENNTVVGYIRKKVDWEVTTNKIQLLTCSSITGTFEEGELLQQNGVTFATVSGQYNGAIYIQHIAGTAVNGVVTGLTSGATATITNVTLLAQNIPDDEAVYWSPVNAYEYELELNIKRKNIRILDARFTTQATKELKNLLRS